MSLKYFCLSSSFLSFDRRRREGEHEETRFVRVPRVDCSPLWYRVCMYISNEFAPPAARRAMRARRERARATESERVELIVSRAELSVRCRRMGWIFHVRVTRVEHPDLRLSVIPIPRRHLKDVRISHHEDCKEINAFDKISVRISILIHINSYYSYLGRYNDCLIVKIVVWLLLICLKNVKRHLFINVQEKTAAKYINKFM